MEINIKRFTNETPQIVNSKTDCFTGDQETVVVETLIFHLEAFNRTSNA
jgi:hypothetical protein